MDDAQLLRYSRHILLNELGIEGQTRLLQSHALIIGLGGLGTPAALYLAASGIGELTLADGDTVDITNLQRQILYTDACIGQKKADAAAAALVRVNPAVRFNVCGERLADDALAAKIGAADIVLDCSDNFATRFAINCACAQRDKPLVSGAAARFSGQVSVFDFRNPTSPCYHCLFPDTGTDDAEPCAVSGVFSPLTGTVGTLQAAEAIKLLAGVGETLNGRLLMIDALKGTYRTISFERDRDCPVCGER